MPRIKNIYVTITDHVQMIGYREIVEIHAKAKGLAGFVFNDVDGSVKLMANGPTDAINGFLEELKAQRPDTVLESMEIKEDISERLDKGNRILGEMNIKLDKLDRLDKLDKLDRLDKLDKLDRLDALDVISNKLDTLPERIAKALRR